MARRLFNNANDFIEQQLDSKLSELEKIFDAQAIAINGPIQDGLDDLIRSSIERRRENDEQGKALIVILTTQGGYVEVVKRIVETIRHYYYTVSFIVPNHAFSAGTVLVMSGDSIYMDYYSRLGPIDPQVQNSNGQFVPALGYLVQWERLLKKAKEEELTLVELQLMLQGFDQAELYQYEQSRELSIALLKEWLAKYKFRNWRETDTLKEPVTDKMRQERAELIARQLNDTGRWHSHGHGISIDILQNELKLKIDDFGSVATTKESIRIYHSLMQDYMDKMRWSGAVHIVGDFLEYAGR